MLTIHKKHILCAIVATTALACSNLALASFFPVSDDEGYYHIGIEGNYLWQSNNTAELNSSGLENTGSSAVLPLIDKTPSASWGGGVDLAYVFASHHYDISASYFFLRSDKSESSAVTFIGGETLPIHADFDYDFDSADILLRHLF